MFKKYVDYIYSTKRDKHHMTKEQLQELARRRGRPALSEEEKKVNGSVRLTVDRWAKLRRLGMTWLSKAIDRAKEPGPKE